jgi:hypothetical protein
MSRCLIREFHVMSIISWWMWCFDLWIYYWCVCHIDSNWYLLLIVFHHQHVFVHSSNRINICIHIFKIVYCFAMLVFGAFFSKLFHTTMCYYYFLSHLPFGLVSLHVWTFIFIFLFLFFHIKLFTSSHLSTYSYNEAIKIDFVDMLFHYF